MLFLGFYVAALLNRGRPERHKRLMMSAAATVIAASTKFLIVAGMIHDLATRRSVHPAWWVGFGVSVAVEGGSLLVAGTPLETPIAQAIASFAGWMY